jgi:serine/threonine protein kinase
LEQKISSNDRFEVFTGRNVTTNREVAIKLEQKQDGGLQLHHEHKLYKHLLGGLHIPESPSYGMVKGRKALVTDLLGPNLEQLFNCCQRRLSLKSLLMVADQLLSCIEYMHKRSIILRNLHPRHLVIGDGKFGMTLYVIDLGLAKEYRHLTTGVHIPYSEGVNFVEDDTFASVNTTAGVQQSRRDDMAAVGYILLYLGKGSLPWQAVARNSEVDSILKLKRTSSEVLFAGFPSEFAQYLDHCRNLGFDEEPNYSFRDKFHGLFARQAFQLDYVFDWVVRKKDRLTAGSSDTNASSHRVGAGKQPQREQDGSELSERLSTLSVEEDWVVLRDQKRCSTGRPQPCPRAVDTSLCDTDGSTTPAQVSSNTDEHILLQLRSDEITEGQLEEEVGRILSDLSIVETQTIRTVKGAGLILDHKQKTALLDPAAGVFESTPGLLACYSAPRGQCGAAKKGGRI